MDRTCDTDNIFLSWQDEEKKPILRRKNTNHRRLSGILRKTFNFSATSNSIPREDFSAMEKQGMIPRTNEFAELNGLSIKQLLNFSTGYAYNQRHSDLNG